jgi:hypothetical protein
MNPDYSLQWKWYAQLNGVTGEYSVAAASDWHACLCTMFPYADPATLLQAVSSNCLKWTGFEFIAHTDPQQAAALQAMLEQQYAKQTTLEHVLSGHTEDVAVLGVSAAAAAAGVTAGCAASAAAAAAAAPPNNKRRRGQAAMQQVFEEQQAEDAEGLVDGQAAAAAAAPRKRRRGKAAMQQVLEEQQAEDAEGLVDGQGEQAAAAAAAAQEGEEEEEDEQQQKELPIVGAGRKRPRHKAARSSKASKPAAAAAPAAAASIKHVLQGIQLSSTCKPRGMHAAKKTAGGGAGEQQPIDL